MGKTLRLLLVTTGALALAGCTPATPAALDECVELVAEHFAITADEVTVDRTEESPGGAMDWYGSASDGEFGCASPDGATLTNAVAFDQDGMPTVLVRP